MLLHACGQWMLGPQLLLIDNWVKSKVCVGKVLPVGFKLVQKSSSVNGTVQNQFYYRTLTILNIFQATAAVLYN